MVRELRKRGRSVEADYYLTTIPTMLYYRGINLEDAYVMTLDEVEWELSKPIPPMGWDNTVWGKSIVCHQ